VTAICVSLTETTTEATLARMAALAPVADLFEVRADLAPDLDLTSLLRARTKPLLFTCRPESEGGRWPDADAEGRRTRLREAVERGFDLVDVEMRSGFQDVIEAKAGRGLVLSLHDLSGLPADLEELQARMTATGADVVKIVGTARSVADLGRLMRLAQRPFPEPDLPSGGADDATGRWRGLVALAMGPLGVPSRILGGRHGAPFTYAAAAPGKEAAPGQLPAELLADVYRVRRIGPETRVYGVLGSDVLRSLSPAIHNRGFAEMGFDAVYVPLQAESLSAFLKTLPDLGLSGFSVTRPYKSEILPHLDSVTPNAAEASSVNTVVVRDGRLIGMSTDGDGVLGPLRRRVELTGCRVTVVGGGGAARAAAFSLGRAGARVTIRARRPEQAAEVAAASRCAHAPRAVVFDMVYEPRETPLLRAARSAGCRTIDGVEMLVAQAVGQFESWTGKEAPVAAMTEAALVAIGGAEVRP
jgi:3-dehydroquinate dehydratase/shikimate dehydrogenase